jgi:uncharacterized protein YcnI
MRQLKITSFVVLLAFVAFNIAFADVSIEERRAAKDAISITIPVRKVLPAVMAITPVSPPTLS